MGLKVRILTHHSIVVVIERQAASVVKVAIKIRSVAITDLILRTTAHTGKVV